MALYQSSMARALAISLTRLRYTTIAISTLQAAAMTAGNSTVVSVVRTVKRPKKSSDSECGRRQAPHASASRPFLSTRFSSFSEGPFGFFCPCSHFCTVEVLVLR